MTKESWLWVGLNITKRNLAGNVGVNPIMGLSYRPIEEVTERLLGRKPYPTLVESLGYITPEKRYLEWVFTSDENFDFDGEARKIIRGIAEYGETAMMAESELSKILSALETCRFTNRTAATYRLPIAYRLAGCNEQADSYLLRALEELAGKTDIYSANIRPFLNTLWAEAHDGSPTSKQSF